MPNEFLQNDEISIDTNVKKISNILHVSAPSLPRHNSSTDLPSKLPAELLSAPLVWVRRGGLFPPLQPLYNGPYAVLRRGSIRVGSWDEVVTVSLLKACTTADATPGSPRRRGRLLGSCPGGPATTKRVSFSDPLVSSPSSYGALPGYGPGTFPTQRGGFCTPGTDRAFTASTDAVPVLSTGNTPEVGLMTSSPPS